MPIDRLLTGLRGPTPPAASVARDAAEKVDPRGTAVAGGSALLLALIALAARVWLPA